MEEIHDVVARSQREIAGRIYQTEANISRQLRELKRHGLVSIVKNKKDGRQRDIRLTAKGKKKLQLAAKIMHRHHSEILKLLDKKHRQAFEHGAEHLLMSLDARASVRRNLGS